MFGLVYFLLILINPIKIIAIKFLSVPRSEINVFHSFPVSTLDLYMRKATDSVVMAVTIVNKLGWRILVATNVQTLI